MWKWTLFALWTVGALAQSVEVRSEFWRPDLARAREIISPAAPRNAFTTFQVLIRGAEKYNFCWAANPEDVFKVDVYASGGQPLASPCADDLTEGTLWLDVWTPDGAPVTRIRLEAQLWFDDRWIIYPMEVRVQDARVPEKRDEDWGAYLCGKARGDWGGRAGRNYRQDVALARSIEERVGRELLVREVVKRFGGATREAWCKSPALGAGEQYLKVRDYLYSVGQPVQ